MREHDSDEDEGFVPTKVEIKRDDDNTTKKKNDDSNQRPLDFQGRYVYGEGIFKKQPPQAYTRFHQYLIDRSPHSNNNQMRMKQQPMHPYEKYINSNDYSLVYTRYKDKTVFSPTSDDFTNNEMNLEKVLSGYNKDHYSMLKNFQMPSQPLEDKDLEFESRFQGGNLMYAFKCKQFENQYTLFLQNDTNTNGYNQWFYFSLRFAKPNTKYKFKIVNFRKKHSFFKQSMNLAVFSRLQAFKNNGTGWYKMGNNIKYQRAPIRKFTDKKFKFYSLSFELQFQHLNDYISVAANLPYTYSRLIHHLKICQQLASKSKNIEWKRQVIGHSIGNNAIPYLSITSKQNDSTSLEEQKQQENNKKVIIILARQHSGETWSSFFMQQILYYLAQSSQNKDVKEMMNKYIIKIFPMLNVDGVIYGNSRCDLGGFDLNRNWKYPDKTLHPQIYAIREEIERLNQQYTIQCVFDLHGHSKQYNIFCYSCKNDNITCRVLPYMISKANPIYHLPYCTFGLSKYKETTARAVIYHLTGNQNVLTIESSTFGTNINNQLIQFSPGHFKDMTASLFQALIDYIQDNQKKKHAVKSIQQNLREILLNQKNNKEGDSGSDSDPLADEIPIKQKLKKILPKTLITVLTQQMEQNYMPIKKKVVKKKKIQNKNVPEKRKNETLVQKQQKIKYQQEQQALKAKTFIQRNSLMSYKKNSKQFSVKGTSKGIPGTFSQESSRNNQTLDSEIPFRHEILRKNNDSNLPFYLRDKPRLVPIKLKNDSLEMFKEAYEFEKKEKIQEQLLPNKPSMKRHRPIKFVKRSTRQQKQEFPLLCVLSQSKKKSHMDKYQNSILNNNSTSATKYVSKSQMQQISIKQHANTIDQPDTKANSQKKMFRTYVQNQKLQRIKKSNQQQKKSQKPNHNATLISKVWRDNVARYGKNLNVFLGDIKGI